MTLTPAEVEMLKWLVLRACAGGEFATHPDPAAVGRLMAKLGVTPPEADAARGIDPSTPTLPAAPLVILSGGPLDGGEYPVVGTRLVFPPDVVYVDSGRTSPDGRRVFVPEARP